MSADVKAAPAVNGSPRSVRAVAARITYPRSLRGFEEAEKPVIDVTTLIQLLSAASTIAVILGVPFIVLQLKQNARILQVSNRQVEVMIHQARAQVFLSIAERLSDREYVLRRKLVRDLVARYASKEWQGFLDSTDAFEIRAFAATYEASATMARIGRIDEGNLQQALGYWVVSDWRAIEPAVRQLERSWGVPAYPNFRWLAESSEAYLKSTARPGL
ncbi:MAG: hypothetical protein L3K14_04460 [Thermoplasmata archaeon]|nr:hypothetical protein [Thermoplasmata archaeon]